MSQNSFDAMGRLSVGDRAYDIYRLEALQAKFDIARLPFSLKVLLENLLRNEDGETIRREDIEALAQWDAKAEPSREISFTPARVVMQDFTGVPAVVDLAAMRDAITAMGGDATKINPLVPAELVIDHSVQVDAFGTREAFARNAELEFERNKERYAFLRWGQDGVPELRRRAARHGHRPSGQPRVPRAGRVRRRRRRSGTALAYPDTLVGTDSHTTMINGLGVLGWGVGGIEAEAAMLGQPMSMLIPQVIGFRLSGELHEGATATDLVLTVTEMLRRHGVVGKFVEFYGAGLANLPLADRATIGNMSPEFGSTCAIFPIDAETIDYLRFSGRPPELIELVEAYAREQGLWHDEDSEEPTFTETLELDLSEVVPSIAGPKRPQDRVSLTESKAAFRMALEGFLPEDSVEDEAIGESFPASDPVSTHHANGVGHEPEGSTGGAQVAERESSQSPVTLADGTETELDHGHVVIAAITSCTNTSNPSVMLGAGILARNAVQRGLKVKPWVKTSLAPGIEGRHRVPRPCRAHRVPRGPRLPPRRLRVYDVHREQRTAARGDLRRRRRRGPGRRERPQREPQLRGTDQPGREDELPRLAAAVRRLRARRDDGHRPLRRAARRGRARRGRVPQGHLAERGGGGRDGRRGGPVGHVPQELQRGVRRRRAVELAEVPTGERFAWDEGSTYVRQPPFFRISPRSPCRSRTSPMRGC